MRRRTTEQITDVSYGNTAALVGIDQFLLKLGTLTTVEEAHKIADTKYSVSPVTKMTVKPNDGKGFPKLIDLPRKKQSCICANQMGCETTGSKQEKFDEISNKMTSRREHPKPAEILERMIRMTENGDD